MKTAKKSLLLLILSVIFTATAFAQTKSIAQKADDLFDQKQYIEALSKYEDAYNKVSNNKTEKNRIYFQMGECYRLMNNFPQAEHIYKKLVSSKYYTSEPKIYFYLAEMCRFENKLDEAANYYDKYIAIAPNDKLAKDRKASLSYVEQLFRDRSRHVIKRLDNWNTPYNDWAPRFVGDDTTKLTFTSSRYGDEEYDDMDAWTGQGFSDIYYVFQDRTSQWSSTPENFDKSGKVNTEVNEGEACFSPDGNTIYFSRCDARENQTQGCYIYYAKKGGSGLEGNKKGKKSKNAPGNDEWSDAVRIELGDTAFNYLYPAVTSDGLTMYFTSDMPKGQGDYDIWMTKRATLADDFGKPVNMGKTINTAGREVFPILRNDSTLYFSSNGLPGIGGQDIFVTEVHGSRCTEPENLGVPINSSYDEMSIIYYPESDHYMMERGYFSSNRPFDDPHNPNIDNKGKQVPELNDDLFYFELPPLLYSIEGTIRDEKSMQLVENAKVKIVGSNGTEYETYTNKKGFYRFDVDQIKRDVIYKMYVSKVDYFTVEGSESTKGYNTDKDIVHDFRIEPCWRTAVW